MAAATNSKKEAVKEEKAGDLKYQVENLKIALKFSNDALAAERQQKLSDRKIFEAKITEVKTKYRKIYEERVEEIEKFCNDKFRDINDKHEARVKSMEDDHEKTLRMLSFMASVPSVDQCMQTLIIPVDNQSVHVSVDEGSVPSAEVATAAVALQVEVDHLRKKLTELVFMNNRYHLAISNCTFCASDVTDTSDASSTCSDESIRVSTPVSSAYPSSGSDPALPSRTIPALMLMSLTTKDRRQAKTDTVKKNKDQSFITRIVKTLTKLETKYQIPEHKRKKR